MIINIISILSFDDIHLSCVQCFYWTIESFDANQNRRSTNCVQKPKGAEHCLLVRCKFTLLQSRCTLLFHSIRMRRYCAFIFITMVRHEVRRLVSANSLIISCITRKNLNSGHYLPSKNT
jgi:hypothetical protein